MELADAFGLIFDANDALGWGHPSGKVAWVADQLTDNTGWLENIAEQSNAKVQELLLRDSAMHLGMAKSEFRAGDCLEALDLAGKVHPCGLANPSGYVREYDGMIASWPADEAALVPTPQAVTAAYLFICERNLNQLRGMWQNPSSRLVATGAAPAP